MKGKVFLFFPVILLSLFPGFKPASGCELEGIKISSTGGRTQCVLVTSGQVDFKEQALSNPQRVYVDLLDSNLKKGFCFLLSKKGLMAAGIIKGVRVAQFDARTVRVVFQFENSPNVSISRPSGKRPPGLVLDFSEGSDFTGGHKGVENNWISRVARPGDGNMQLLPEEKKKKKTYSELALRIDQIKQEALGVQSGDNTLDGQIKGKALNGAGKDNTGAPLKKAVPSEVFKAPALNNPALKNDVRQDISTRNFPQFHKWRVVIDPGHGGKDPGTSGKDGRHEKEFTLAIANRLAKILRKSGFQVYLTRDEDYFVTLDNRTVMANRDRADIFVSIHINWSSNPNTRGITTYFLNWTNDMQANRVAARENQISLKRQKEARTGLGYILASLELEGKRDSSLSLANYIENSVTSSVHADYPGEPSLGVKGALFYVLVGDKMPATLTEVSFLSNSRDSKLLADPSYLDEVAKGMAAGIKNYFRSAPVRALRAMAYNFKTNHDIKVAHNGKGAD